MTFPITPRHSVCSSLFLLVVVSGILARAHTAFAWGGGHRYITEGALAALPPWEKDLLGKELALLGREHCVIPDKVYADKEIARYAMMDTKPNQGGQRSIGLKDRQGGCDPWAT